MASTTPHQTQTELAQERGPTGNIQHDGGLGSSLAATASVAAGALGVGVGIIPGLGIGAFILAAIALLVGVPAMRAGDGAVARRGRIGVVLAVVAIVFGALNIAIQLDLFNYFTTEESDI